MNTFLLEILTPEEPFFRGECASLVIPTGDGMLGIMANRAPLTAAIHHGAIFYSLPDGSRRICAVERGMITFSGNRARVLCESAVAPDAIDVEAEKRALAEAEAELSEKRSNEEYLLSQLAFARAFNRLRVKESAENRKDREP